MVIPDLDLTKYSFSLRWSKTEWPQWRRRNTSKLSEVTQRLWPKAEWAPSLLTPRPPAVRPLHHGVGDWQPSQWPNPATACFWKWDGGWLRPCVQPCSPFLSRAGWPWQRPSCPQGLTSLLSGERVLLSPAQHHSHTWVAGRGRLARALIKVPQQEQFSCSHTLSGAEHRRRLPSLQPAEDVSGRAEGSGLQLWVLLIN